MKQTFLAACFVAFALAGAPAWAEDMQDVLVSQLSQQGFTHINISRTFLGRVRVFARSDSSTREIIYNPRTGEILRDYWSNLTDPSAAPDRLVEPGFSSETGGPANGAGGGAGGGAGSNDGPGADGNHGAGALGDGGNDGAGTDSGDAGGDHENSSGDAPEDKSEGDH